MVACKNRIIVVRDVVSFPVGIHFLSRALAQKELLGIFEQCIHLFYLDYFFIIAEQRNLNGYPSLMVVTPDADFNGQCEFSVVTKSLFAPDGTVVHRYVKGTSMSILKTFGGEMLQRTTTDP